MELRRFAGWPCYVFQFGAFESVTVAADGWGEAPFVHHPPEALVAQARPVVQGPLESAGLIESYDAYYYSVGTGARRRLPVLRLAFDDPVTRLMYVDPHTGSIARAYDTHAMVMRWAVIGLHRLDFPFLIRNRSEPWRSGAERLGVVLGWRRLRPRRR